MAIKVTLNGVGRALSQVVLLLPLISLFGILFIYPLIRLFRISLGERRNFEAYHYILSHNVFRNVFFNTGSLSLETAFLSVIICVPLVYILITARPALTTFILSLISLPFWMSILVRSFAWTVLLQKYGVVNNFFNWLGLPRFDLIYKRFSVLAGMIYIFIPYVVLILFDSFKKVDNHLLRTGFCLGANKIENFFKVFLPQVGTSITISFLYVFILSFGYFITPSLLGGAKDTTISMFIDIDMNQTLNWTQGAALSFLIIIVILPFLLFGIVFGHKKKLSMF